MPSLLIIADDLSGAAETAGAVAATAGAPVELRLDASPEALPEVLAIDTHSRALRAAAAGPAVLAAIEHAGARSFVYKKVDSLLRGHIGAEARALRMSGRRVAAALAVPRVGRTVSGGIVHVHGVPLTSSGLLAGEHEHECIADALGVEALVIPVETIRSRELDAVVRSTLDGGLVPIFDGEIQNDLDAVAATLVRLDRRPVVLAAGGLARSIAPLLGLRGGVPRFAPGADRVLVVVGTRATSAARQATLLVELGLRGMVLRPGEQLELDGGDAVVTLAADAAWDGASLDDALTSAARAVLALGGRTDLVLTGGDTARRVLDALGVRRLHSELELEDGTVLSTTDDGAAVVTRPGSFGDDGSLARVVTHLRGIPA